ncbi:hypothetical protein MUG10_06465 [Xanthomonas prunicola]|uniref:hypothetical protein n=1 Tax=Xanthomonas prunicola TaxID=2053930 RepID=UPI0020791635|nr:hypothetical protein [Xanthomonas prunicola]USJ01811.1 hypothetical protein MUG10_06465 [Xanthomonas prunicola]
MSILWPTCRTSNTPPSDARDSHASGNCRQGTDDAAGRRRQASDHWRANRLAALQAVPFNLMDVGADTQRGEAHRLANAACMDVAAPKTLLRRIAIPANNVALLKKPSWSIRLSIRQ